MTVHHFRDGGLAQLGEHLLCKQGVIGSIPIVSTNLSLVGVADDRRYAPPQIGKVFLLLFVHKKKT